MENEETKVVELMPSSMSIHIASWREDNGVTIVSEKLENREVEVTISYPLRTNHTFIYKDKSGVGCVNDLINIIITKYKWIYSKPEKFGIWGHCLEDLVIEALNLDTESNKIILYVGS